MVLTLSLLERSSLCHLRQVAINGDVLRSHRHDLLGLYVTLISIKLQALY